MSHEEQPPRLDVGGGYMAQQQMDQGTNSIHEETMPKSEKHTAAHCNTLQSTTPDSNSMDEEIGTVLDAPQKGEVLAATNAVEVAISVRISLIGPATSVALGAVLGECNTLQHTATHCAAC